MAKRGFHKLGLAGWSGQTNDQPNQTSCENYGFGFSEVGKFLGHHKGIGQDEEAKG
jgi:hypothetical protein